MYKGSNVLCEEFDEMKNAGLGQPGVPLDDIGVAVEPPRDTGIMAADRLREKNRARRTAKLIGWLFLLMVATLVGLSGWYVWESRINGRATDYRECTMMVGDREVTGRRSYSYPYMELLGHRIVDSQKVIEETRMDVRGSAMTIVGLEQNNAGWWSVHVGTGEQGVQMLKPAAIYTVVMDKKTGVIEYSEFCK